jgi:hypothetical protein
VSSPNLSPALPKKVSISEHVLFQAIEGEGVLLDMAAEQYFGLDDVGTRIWQLLTEEGDTGKVLAQLLKIYDADEVTLRRDLANLIDQLRHDGLVRVES